jgi:hypothetical protein
MFKIYNMTKYIFATALLFNLTLVFGQTSNFQWAKKWNTYSAFDIATDDQGNVYTLSSGSTQVNFNPSGIPVMGPTAGCGAISKFDSNGNIVWVKFITKGGGTGGSCVPKRLFIKGNYIYYSGEFGDGGGIYDFDLSNTATYNVGGSCNGCGIQGFISKIDLDGNFQWFESFGQKVTVKDLFVDNWDNAYVTGGFQNAMSLGNQAVTSNGHIDAYVFKISSTGVSQWIKSVGSNASYSDQEYGVGVCVNDLGEVFFVGNFMGTVDLNPGIGVSTVTSQGLYDLFLIKLDSTGNFISSGSIGALEYDYATGIDIDVNNNFVVTGRFSGTVDFDFGLGTISLSTQNPQISAAFIAKYSSQNNLLWVNKLDNCSSRAVDIGINGNIYVSGVFGGTVDFDPSAGIVLQTAGYGNNTYVLSLNGLGGYLWSGIIQTGAYNPNYDIQSNEPENIFAKPDGIYISGNFAAPTDFDPGTGVFTLTSMTSPNGYQQYSTAFILKLSQCPATSTNLAVSSCGSYFAPDGQVYNQSGQYTSVLTNAAGCDSVVTINLTINQSSTSAITATSCGSYLSPTGNNYSFSGVYTDTLTTISGCDSIVTINLAINTVDTTVVKNGSTLTANQNGATYQWFNCTTNQPITNATSQSYTASSPGWYAVMVTINGCSELSACKQIKKVSLPNPPLNGTANLEEEQLSDVLIYPNPINDQITIQFESPNEWEVELIDLSGRQVLKSTNEKVIDVSGLNSGMYRVIVRSREFQFQQALVKM